MIDASVNPNVFMHVSNFIGMENFAAGNRQWFLWNCIFELKQPSMERVLKSFW